MGGQRGVSRGRALRGRGGVRVGAQEEGVMWEQGIGRRGSGGGQGQSSGAGGPPHFYGASITPAVITGFGSR